MTNLKNTLFGAAAGTLAMALFLVSGAGHVLLANLMQ